MTDQPELAPPPSSPAPAERVHVPFVLPEVPWLKDVLICGVDTETTGLSPVRDRIVQLGAVVYCNGSRLASFRSLCNPERPIPEAATRVHGVTDEMAAAAPAFSAVLKEMWEALDIGTGQQVLFVGHNSDFDRIMLLSEVARAGLDSSWLHEEDEASRWLCTMAIAKSLKGAGRYAKGFRLADLCGACGVPLDWSTHDALDDAEAAVRLLHVIAKWCPKGLDETHAMQHLWLSQNG